MTPGPAARYVQHDLRDSLVQNKHDPDTVREPRYKVTSAAAGLPLRCQRDRHPFDDQLPTTVVTGSVAYLSQDHVP